MTDEDNTDIVTLPDQLYGELLHRLQVRLAVTEPAVGAQGTGTRLEYSVQVFRCVCVQEYRCTGSRCLYNVQYITTKICRCEGLKV